MEQMITSIRCRRCGHRNDLDRIDRVGYERSLECCGCGEVERWSILDVSMGIAQRAWDLHVGTRLST
ncbi:MAG TPA: hypothetical protein VM345_12870 [Acidimicrobiales bacterium]|jgi:uncharacterized Zn finger protein|nr:hypothetical protein [Acidimicrobiales bacterium]